MSNRFKLKSEFLKNSFTLIIGTGLSQTIPVLLQFPLRRMFSPSEFGVYAIYSSIVSVLAILANFRYANTVLIPKKEEDGANLMFGSLLISFIFSLLVLLVFTFFGTSIIDYFNFPEELEKWGFLIPLSVFLVSSHLTFGFWLSRKKEFKKFAINKVSRRTAEGLFQITLGSKAVKGGLIIGTIIGDIINFLTYVFQIRKSVIPLLSKISFANIKIQIVRYVKFPKYSLLPSFLDNFSLMLPVFIITDFYSESITGQYDLTAKILSVPLALISIALSQVLVQKIVEQRNNSKPIVSILKPVFLTLLSLSALGVLVVHFFGESIFVFAFGEQWKLAGELSTYLIFIYGIRFIVSPMTSVFIALEEIKISSIWQVCYFGAILSLYLLKGCDLITFISYFILIDVIAYSVYGILIIMISKKHDGSLS